MEKFLCMMNFDYKVFDRDFLLGPVSLWMNREYDTWLLIETRWVNKSWFNYWAILKALITPYFSINNWWPNLLKVIIKYYIFWLKNIPGPISTD